MRSGILARIMFVLWLCPAGLTLAQPWQSLGPEGGSVRSLSFDPQDSSRVFLGTSAGMLYLSTDGGASWSRSVHLGSPSEMVLDHIVIDPANSRNLYVAAWNAQAPNSDGDLFRSRNGGKTWEIVPDLHGKSIRALAVAASDPRTLVAGALDGVFRSRDGGDNWERISPEKQAELKQVESVAIDPANPDAIYVGTWHLPWKTDDGGKTWRSIKKGVIDDSDVFSIVIDSASPANVYISACSGIYRSDSAGDLFRKLQGIPYSARRTRSLRIDPVDHNVVYAGTTEGLWKTADAGATWQRMTGANVIVNDVLIDPQHPARLLLATDRGGVLSSDDGGVTFTASNRGFTHRQVAALLVDRADSSVIFAGLLNDKEFGGAFVSRDRGETWRQIGEGLDGRDVIVLRQAADNSVIAGTDRGVFRLRPGSTRWLPANRMAGAQTEAAPATVPVRMNQAAKTNHAAARPGTAELSSRVTDLELTPQRWFAATAAGFLVSS
ncbi:MAG TPA: transcriptional regulator, partial [Candidatus Angelobacter sp.]